MTSLILKTLPFTHQVPIELNDANKSALDIWSCWNPQRGIEVDYVLYRFYTSPSILKNPCISLLSYHLNQSEGSNFPKSFAPPLFSRPLKEKIIMSLILLRGTQSSLTMLNNLCQSTIVIELCKKRWSIISSLIIYIGQWPWLRALWGLLTYSKSLTLTSCWPLARRRP